MKTLTTLTAVAALVAISFAQAQHDGLAFFGQQHAEATDHWKCRVLHQYVSERRSQLQVCELGSL